MHVLPRTATALVVAAILGLACATAAPASVSPTLSESGTELDVENFAIAMNPAGERSALVYEGRVRGSRVRRTLLRARLGRGRTFASSQRLDDLRRGPGIRANVSLSDVKVAVAPDGTAVAAWISMTATRDFGRAAYSLRVATAPAGKRFGRPLTALRSPRSFSIEGLVAGRGGLTVLGVLRGHRIEAAVRRGSGRFGTHQRIGSSNYFQAPPTFALAPGGTVLAAWSPMRGAEARAAVLSRGARRFRASRQVSAAGEATKWARAVAGPGGAGVSWSTTPRRLRFARLRRSDNALTAPATLADAGASGGPHVALPVLGIATAWRHYRVFSEPGDTDVLRESRVAANASWLGDTAARRLSEPPALAERPVVAALSIQALIAWREIPQYDLQARIRLAVASTGGWQPTVSLAPDGPPGRRSTATFGIDEDERPGGADLAIAAGSRRALLAWIAFTQADDGETRRRVRVASYRP